MSKRVCLIILVISCNLGLSQKMLDVHYHSLFGKEKLFQFFNNSTFDYKMKGDLFYQTHKLVNMNDSLLIFDNDVAVKLSDLRVIKIRGGRFSHWFFTAGVLFFLLDTGNNIFNGHATIVNEQTAVFTAICFAGGIIVKRIQDKHLHIRKHVVLRVVDAGYEDLAK